MKTINKILLSSFILFSFTSCSKEKKEVAYSSNLIKPEINSNDQDNLQKNYPGEWISWYHNSEKDPSAATKIGYAYSEELKDYKKALEWYKYADSMKPMADNSNYACYAYQQLKEYDKSIEWCKKAIELGNNEGYIGLGFTYSQLEKYEESIKWYTKALEKNHKDAKLNIATVKVKMKKYKEAEILYKEVLKDGNLDALQGLSVLYFNHMDDKLKAAAYAISGIGTKYSKSSVILLLQIDWKIQKDILEKAYDLQLNSDEFKVKYKGKIRF